MLSVGIVGLPNVGKSTLFNALTKKAVPAENFPFCTIDPSVGVVGVPDERLRKLAEFSHSQNTIPTAIEFIDIAGLVEGASGGAGLGNQFLAHIREADAIAHMVRLFDDPDVHHVSGSVDPFRDIEVINMELAMADMQTVLNRKQGITRELKTGSAEVKREADVLTKIEHALDAGRMVRHIDFSDKEKEIVKGLHLISAKPMLYVLNKKGHGHNLDELNDGRYEKLIEALENEGAHHVTLDAGVECELCELADEDKEEFRREYGYFENGLDALITHAYALLGLITFFTTGEKETRAWTVVKGGLASEAGAAIHSDFRDKFIRASVINWQTLLNAGSYAAAREQGLVLTEGKEYVMQDGDVVEFRI